MSLSAPTKTFSELTEYLANNSAAQYDNKTFPFVPSFDQPFVPPIKQPFAPPPLPPFLPITPPDQFNFTQILQEGFCQAQEAITTLTNNAGALLEQLGSLVTELGTNALDFSEEHPVLTAALSIGVTGIIGYGMYQKCCANRMSKGPVSNPDSSSDEEKDDHQKQKIKKM